MGYKVSFSLQGYKVSSDLQGYKVSFNVQGFSSALNHFAIIPNKWCSIVEEFHLLHFLLVFTHPYTHMNQLIHQSINQSILSRLCLVRAASGTTCPATTSSSASPPASSCTTSRNTQTIRCRCGEGIGGLIKVFLPFFFLYVIQIKSLKYYVLCRNSFKTDLVIMSMQNCG